MIYLFICCSLNSDVASGKEMSDGYESLPGGGKGDGKPRKHHRKSARTRSRQEKASKPKLSMLNVSCEETNKKKYKLSVCYGKTSHCPCRFATLVIKWLNADWRLTTTKW